jgi:hypothetical protein
VNLAHIRADKSVDTAWCAKRGNVGRKLDRSGDRLYASGGRGPIRGASRDLIVSFNARTGALLPWMVALGTSDQIYPAEVSALAVAGSSVYLGGGFATVNGLDRRRLAAVNAITGEVSGWSPKPDGRVEVIAVSGGRIYVGGRFRRIAGRQRRGLAAFDARTGRLLDWNPALDGTVTTLAISGRMVYVGYFPSARDSHGWRVAPIDGVSGNAGGWKRVLSGAVEAIAVSGPVVYVGGWGERLVALAARTGRRTTWKPNPDGDVDAIAVSGPESGGRWRVWKRRPSG